MLAAFNFTPVPRFGYRLGVPWGGRWMEVGNGDAAEFGGSGLGNGGVEAEEIEEHGRPFRFTLTLPPLGGDLPRGVRCRLAPASRVARPAEPVEDGSERLASGTATSEAPAPSGLDEEP